jgi:hypothetical protein
MADTSNIPTDPTGNPVPIVRALLEERIPPEMRADDWNERWSRIDAMVSEGAQIVPYPADDASAVTIKLGQKK